jgi:golgi-specific brefeldin A-resistance guanine nucleotide exchange factor 1
VSFDLLARQPPAISSAVAEQVAAGLILIASKHPDIVSSQTEWNIVFALVKSTIGHSEASKQAFEFIQSLIESTTPRVTVDNFSGLVSVLDDYATAASIATEAQQQGRRTQMLNMSKYV